MSASLVWETCGSSISGHKFDFLRRNLMSSYDVNTSQVKDVRDATKIREYLNGNHGSLTPLAVRLLRARLNKSEASETAH